MTCKGNYCFSRRVRSCVVLHCNSVQIRGIANIAFHRFPRNEDLRKKWIKAINWNELGFDEGLLRYENSDSLICSLHFEDKCYSTNKRIRLKKLAVPSLHLPTPPLHLPTPPLHLPTPPLHLPTPPLHLPTPPLHLPTPPLHLPTPHSENANTADFEPIILKKEELIKLEEPEISPESVHPCDRTPSKNDDFSSQLIKTKNNLISQDAVNPLADTSQVEKPIINTSYESHIPWPSWMSKSDQVYFSSIDVEDLQVILKKLYAERHHQILNISLQPIDFTKVIEEQLKNKIQPSTESKDNLEEEEEVPCPKTEENHFIFVQNGVCNEEDLLNMSTEGCEQLRTNDWDIITKQELIED